MRRNPSPRWFKRLQVPYKTTARVRERYGWINATGLGLAADALDELARVDENSTAAQKRRVAARLALLRGAVLALHASQPWDSEWRTNGEAAEALDRAAVAIGEVVDAQVETLLGKWRGSLAHTRVPPFDAAAVRRSYEEINDVRAEMTGVVFGDQMHGPLLRLHSELDNAIALLVDYDQETRESFERLEGNAVAEAAGAFPSARKRAVVYATERRSHAMSPEEIRERQQTFARNRYKSWLADRSGQFETGPIRYNGR